MDMLHLLCTRCTLFIGNLYVKINYICRNYRLETFIKLLNSMAHIKYAHSIRNRNRRINRKCYFIQDLGCAEISHRFE